MAGFLRARRRRRLGATRADVRCGALRRDRDGLRRRLRLAAIILRVAAFCAALRRFAIGLVLFAGGRFFATV